MDSARSPTAGFISVRTERDHVSSILAKLGVHSHPQPQALVFALRYGVVHVPREI